MYKVAIIIPTMNRPEFILRQLRFYEMTKSPHPVYISDSSNEENAEKIKEGIKQFKNLSITYQWAPAGKDYLHQLMSMVKEKYCVQMGDDDIAIPKTISECAGFLESNLDYGTCMGKQVNIRLRREDYNKPYGIIERQTRPFGESIEDDDLMIRVKHFWSDSSFICFAVRRTEVERSIRDITKNFSLMDRMTEFLIVSILLMAGKSKVLNKLGYIMQISDVRYGFGENLTVDLVTSAYMNEKWNICREGLLRILDQRGLSGDEGLKIAKGLMTLYLAQQFSREAGDYSDIKNKPIHTKKETYKKIVNLLARYYRFKKILNKTKKLLNLSSIESGYQKDFEIVKEFLEK